MKEIKSMLLVVAGLCWLLFAGVIGLILVHAFTDGAGLPGLGFLRISSLTVVLGLGQVIGLAAAAFVCFSIGLLLCLHGLIPTQPEAADAEVPQPSPD